MSKHRDGLGRLPVMAARETATALTQLRIAIAVRRPPASSNSTGPSAANGKYQPLRPLD